MFSLLFQLAAAQQVACEPVAVATLTDAVQMAETKMSSPSAGRAALDQARDAARCLAVPIDPTLLGRIAWLEAEWAILDQSPELAGPWVTLATDVGQPKIPIRIGPGHPMRRWFDERPEAPPVGGPESVKLDPPKRGVVYADGVVLEQPRVRLDTPHLVQVFVKDELYLGVWQSGPNFPRSLLVAEGVEAPTKNDAHDSIPPENWKPARTNTVEAYELWIKKHPKGPWLEEARGAIDALAWDKAQADGSELAYRQYLYDHPEGQHKREAAFLVENDAYTKLLEKPSRQKWKDFLERFPEGAYATEAQLQMDTIDFAVAQRANTPSAYRAFFDAHPKSVLAKRALIREERRFFEKAWMARSQRSMQDYLEQWPTGVYVADAKAALGAVAFKGASLSVTGLTEDDNAEVRDALVKVLEKRALPIADGPGDGVGAITLAAVTWEERDFQRLSAELQVSYKGLEWPLVQVDIDTTLLQTDDLGLKLGEMAANAFPLLAPWHIAPEPEPEAKPPVEVEGGR